MRNLSWMFLLFLTVSLWAVEGDEVENQEPVLGEKITWEKDGSEMMRIPAGSFEMGDSKNEPEDWMKHSRRVHTVELDAFYMDVYEVTVGQFMRFVQQSGYQYGGNWNDIAQFSSGDEYPIVYVSWNDATAYAKWAGKRLPTEAEWEYAARGGLVGKRYFWGDEKPDGSQCNFADKNSPDRWSDKTVDDGYRSTAPVGSFIANGYGLYDMAGNVWEWCQDWYGEDYYSKSPAKNPPGPETGKYRVLRGGGWGGNTDLLRVAYRDSYAPNNRHNGSGFRCVSGSK